MAWFTHTLPYFSVIYIHIYTYTYIPALVSHWNSSADFGFLDFCILCLMCVYHSVCGIWNLVRAYYFKLFTISGAVTHLLTSWYNKVFVVVEKFHLKSNNDESKVLCYCAMRVEVSYVTNTVCLQWLKFMQFDYNIYI